MGQTKKESESFSMGQREYLIYLLICAWIGVGVIMCIHDALWAHQVINLFKINETWLGVGNFYYCSAPSQNSLLLF